MVNVHVNSKDILVSSVDCSVTPLVLEHSYYVWSHLLLGEYCAFSVARSSHYNSAPFCRMDRGYMK